MNPNDNGRNRILNASPVIHRVVVEIRADRKLHVIPDGGLDPTDPLHAAMIIDMLCSGAAAFARIRVPVFEKRLIEEIKKPGIEIVRG
jgi:hypothetical protein